MVVSMSTSRVVLHWLRRFRRPRPLGMVPAASHQHQHHPRRRCRFPDPTLVRRKTPQRALRSARCQDYYRHCHHQYPERRVRWMYSVRPAEAARSGAALSPHPGSPRGSLVVEAREGGWVKRKGEGQLVLKVHAAHAYRTRRWAMGGRKGMHETTENAKHRLHGL